MIHERDRHTDRHRMTAKAALDASIARQKRERGRRQPCLSVAVFSVPSLLLHKEIAPQLIETTPMM